MVFFMTNCYKPNSPNRHISATRLSYLQKHIFTKAFIQTKGGLPYGLVLFQQIFFRSLVGMCCNSILVFLKTWQHSFILSCKTQSPIGKNTLSIYYMLKDIFNSPLSFLVTIFQFVFGNGLKKRQGILKTGY